jgi:hypothetical protein
MNKSCSILQALSGITKQWARRGMLLSCRRETESGGRSKYGISLPRYQAISCSVQNECHKHCVVGLMCVCVLGGGIGFVTIGVHSLLWTARDNKWPHVAVVWVTILFRIRVVSDTDLAPTVVYPELASFFILIGFLNIKLVLQIRLRPFFLTIFPLAILLCDRKVHELLW